MNVTKEFPSEWITATDLIGPDGRPSRPTLTVKGLAKDTARDPRTGGDKVVPALAFRESIKRLRLNRSSLALLVRAWGSESDNWTGKQVTLEVLATNLTDKTTGEKKCAVLVRPAKDRPKPEANPSAGPPEHAEGCDDVHCAGECMKRKP